MPVDLSAWNPVDHPRDRHGRFRDKWGLSDRAKRIFARVLSGVNARGGPMSFRNDPHVQSYLDGQARRSRRSKQQQASLDYYLTPANEDRDAGWTDINSTLRAGSEDSPIIRHMDSMMEPLEHDLLLTRVLGPEAFGLRPEQIEDVEEWTGKLVTDQAYQSMNAGTPYPVQGPHVTLSVIAPRGTKAIVPGGNDRTVILDRDQPIRITHVQRDGKGGVYVYAVATPNQKTGEPTRNLGSPLSPREIAPATDATPEEMTRRGLTPEGTPDPNAPAPPTADQQDAARAERFARPNAPTPARMEHGRPPRQGAVTQRHRDTATLAERVSNAVADGRDLDAQRRGALEYVENAPRGEDAKENRALDRLAGRIRRAKDREGIMSALDEFTEERGLRRTGAEPGDVVDFNPDTMEPISRRNVVVGDPVRVISAGYETGNGPDREVLSRQRVTIDSDTDKATLRRMRQERAQRNGRVPEPNPNAPAPAQAAPEPTPEAPAAPATPEAPAANAPEAQATTAENIVQQVRDGGMSRNRARDILDAREAELRNSSPASAERADIRHALGEIDAMERREPGRQLPALEPAAERRARQPRAPRKAAKKAAPAAPTNGPDENGRLAPTLQDGERPTPEVNKEVAQRLQDGDLTPEQAADILLGKKPLPAKKAAPEAPAAPTKKAARKRAGLGPSSTGTRVANGREARADGGRNDYENMRVPELRAEAQRRGLPARSNTRRADLVSMLKGDDNGKTPNAPEASKPRMRAPRRSSARPMETNAPEGGGQRRDYDNMRVPELRAEAQRRGLPARSNMRRADLVELLRNNEGGGPSAPSNRERDLEVGRDADIRGAMDAMVDRLNLTVENDGSPRAATATVRAAMRRLRLEHDSDGNGYTWRHAGGDRRVTPSLDPDDTDPDMRRARRMAYLANGLEDIANSSDSREEKLRRIRAIRKEVGDTLSVPDRGDASKRAKKALNEPAPVTWRRAPVEGGVVTYLSRNGTVTRTRGTPGYKARRANGEEQTFPDVQAAQNWVDEGSAPSAPPVKKAAKKAAKAAKKATPAAPEPPAPPTSPYEGQRVAQLREQATQRGLYVPSGTRREGIVALLEKNDRGERVPSRFDREQARRDARFEERRRVRREEMERDRQAAITRLAQQEARRAEQEAQAEAQQAIDDAAQASIDHPDGLGRMETDRLRSLAREYNIPDAQDLGRDELLEKLREEGAVAVGLSNDVSLSRTQLAKLSTKQLHTLAVQRDIDTSELRTRNDYIAAMASRYRSDSAPDLVSLNADLQAIFSDSSLSYHEVSVRARDLVTPYVNGDYAGLRVEIIQVNPIGHGFTFQARIFDQDGREVGSTTRQIHMPGPGEGMDSAYVYNAYLQIIRRHQGSGFAEEWNNNLFAWYKRSGIKRVKVSANIDVGGYTWATKGFEFADERTAQHMWDRLGDTIDQYIANPTPALKRKLFGDATPEQIAEQIAAARTLIARAASETFGTPNYPTSFSLSQLGRRPGQRGKTAKWLGKGVMLGSGWSGILHL